MRRVLVSLIGAAAALAALVVGYAMATAPPRARRPVSASAGLAVWGAYHVHSARSDGSGSVDDIASAAARAGLSFVIFTDHGDGTTPPDAPRYRHGVLCLDAVEVNSEGGHIVALNLQRPSAYPLAGEARDVIEDIRRLGGWTVAAHPDSSRERLRWRARDVRTDGVEWINADAEWRTRPLSTVLASAVRALVRPPESIASLFQAPVRGMQRWDAWQQTRPVFALAALDAHARVGADDDGEGGSPRGLAIAFPSYENLFRTIAQAVTLDRPLTGDGAADAAAVLAAIGAGRTYSVLRAFADALPAVTFTAEYAGGTVGAGGRIPRGTAALIRVEIPVLPDARILLLQDGRDVASGQGRLEFRAPPGGASAYRVEAYVDDRPIPWIVTNAIYTESPPAPLEARPPPNEAPTEPASITHINVVPTDWRIEANSSSAGTLGEENGTLRLDYRLGSGPPAGQYVAIATSASGSAALDRIEFVASSPTPMRLSVQVRLPGGVEGQRWRRSIYVDNAPRPFSIRLADLEPVNRSSPLRPIVARVQSVLLVVDTVNARPGTAGQLRVGQVRLVAVSGEAGARRP